MNPDFLDILSEFSRAGVEYLLVGAYALATYGTPRATGDIDLWIRISPENARRVLEALRRFGAPLDAISIEDLTTESMVFQIGVPPRRIDVLTSIDGVTFPEAWAARTTVTVEGIVVPVIGKAEFIKNKRAVGRPKDLADLSYLERDE